MTAAIALSAACVALAIGIVLGLVLSSRGTRFGRRGTRSGSRGTRSAPAQQVRPLGRNSQGPTVGELARLAVQTGHNGTVIFDASGELMLHNERAVALGLIAQNRVHAEARTAAERAARTGETVPVELPRTTGSGPPTVLGEARSLLDRCTVVDVHDHSEIVRLEATRRDFVANVSHELKTPVGAMSVLAEALCDGASALCDGDGDASEVRRFAGKILGESNRLGKLVGELISLSRLEGAEQPPDLVETDIDGVVEEALHRCELAADAHDIEIIADPPSGLTVSGDHALLVTALANLLDNAIAYSPSGSEVSVARTGANGFVELAVTDRGMGIACEHQQRVFERFYRVDTARSRATGGTGLGLAIVKHVAANHGGAVRLRSAPGSGSTFSIRVPETASSPVPPGAAGPEPASRTTPETTL